MKIDEQKLKDSIITKFGTQANLAEKLNVSEGVITRGIKYQSPKYLALFKKGGIDIDALLLEEEGKKKGNLEYQLKVADKRIKELEDLLEQKNRFLEQKDNLIKSYELIFKSQLIEKK